MNIEAYFERIGYSGSTAPTIDTLRAIHRAHMMTVPFENLNIHLPRPISLEQDDLFDKIVTRRRGGFCYEQNGLFSAVLRTLGFEVTLMRARVSRADGTLSIPFSHLTLLVHLEERWLADVGFGESFLEPLRFDDPNPQWQTGGAFRLTHDGTKGMYTRRDPAGTWHDCYQLFLQPYQLSDFSDACHYQQTSPESHFTKERICSMATLEGRITLSGWRYIVTKNGRRQEQPIADEAAFEHILQTDFGMLLPL